MTATIRSLVSTGHWSIVGILLSGCSPHSTPATQSAPESQSKPVVKPPAHTDVAVEHPTMQIALVESTEPTKTTDLPTSVIAATNGATLQAPLRIDERNLKRLDDLYFTGLVHGKRSAQFRTAIQGLREDLPELTVASGDEPLKWRSIEAIQLSPTLNTGKHLISLFRFRSSLSQPADLHLSFAVPMQFGELYIVSANRETDRFESLKFDRNITVPEAPLPPGSLFAFDELMGGKILPGEEYVICYIPPDGTDKQMHAGLRLTPEGTHQPGGTAAEIRRTLGVKASTLEFAQTEVGLRNAYAVAHRMVHYKPQDTEGLKQVLRSVWTQLPEVRVATGSDDPVWNHVTPDLSFRFLAVRFKSPLDRAAELNWCHVVEKNQLRWGLVSKEVDLNDVRSYGVEVNCSIPGIANSNSNLAVFQRLSDGQIDPGAEYVIWFAPAEGALPDIDLAVRLLPTSTPSEPDATVAFNDGLKQMQMGSVLPRTEVQAIGRTLGLDIPTVPSAERVAAALERCRQMIAEGKQTSWKFNHLLQFAAPGLPLMESNGENARWNRIELNSNGLGMAAYRIGEDQLSQGRITFALARPRTVDGQDSPARQLYYDTSREVIVSEPKILRWGLVHPDHPGIFTTYRFAENDVAQLGLSIPPNSGLDVEVYEKLETHPDRPFVVVLSPPDSSPMSIHFAVKVEDRPKIVDPPDIIAALEYMGFHHPVPENSGRVLGQHQHPVSIIQFVGDDFLMSSSMDGEVKWWNLLAAKDDEQQKPGTVRGLVQAFSPAQSRLAAVDYRRRTIAVHHARTLEQQVVLSFPDSRDLQSFSFSPDGQSLLGCYYGNGNESIAGKSAIWIWDLRKNDPPQKRDFTKDEPIISANWLPDGRIAIAGYKPSPEESGLPDSASSESKQALKVPMRTGVVYFLDGLTLATKEKKTEEGADWLRLAPSADGTRMGMQAYTDWITVWDLKADQPVVSLPQSGWGKYLSLSKDGHRLASVNMDGDVGVWDLDSRRTLRLGDGRIPRASSAAISLSGDKVALGGNDGKVRLYDLMSPGSPPEFMTDSIDLRLNWIPSGEFLMGVSDSPRRGMPVNPGEDDGRPQHAVRITRPFYMSRYEVTVAQFRKFVEATGYLTTAETSGKGGSHIFTSNTDFRDDPKLNWKSPGFPQQGDHPVVQVCYHDAVAFCEWLSKKEQARYRLPTEAEWEYACRAGTTSLYYHGSGIWSFRSSNVRDKELIDAYGGFDGAFGNSDGNAYTARVGSYVPNGFGLFDMHGNVWEWCSDWYGPTYYANSPTDNPPGAHDGQDRILRGGSFLVGPSNSAWREAGPPNQVRSHLGFRVVREIP